VKNNNNKVHRKFDIEKPDDCFIMGFTFLRGSLAKHLLKMQDSIDHKKNSKDSVDSYNFCLQGVMDFINDWHDQMKGLDRKGELMDVIRDACKNYEDSRKADIQRKSN